MRVTSEKVAAVRGQFRLFVGVFCPAAAVRPDWQEELALVL